MNLARGHPDACDNRNILFEWLAESTPMGVLPAVDDVELEHDFLHLVVHELVSVALETPLREPILTAVLEQEGQELTHSEPELPPTDEGDDSRLTTAVQGLIVFVVMFLVLYITLRHLTKGETAN